MNPQRVDVGAIEWKFDAAEPQSMSFTGYGAVYGNVDSYGDVIQSGAAARYLSDVHAGRTPWPLMLSQHGGMGLTAEDMTPVGVWTRLSEDGRGLRVEGRLADTPRGREIYSLMKMEPRPALDGMSIGYVAKTWTPRTKPEEPKRLLTDIELLEISVVSRPANRLARIDGVKSIEQLMTLRDCEDYLRAAGMSKAQAVAFIAQIKRVGPGEPVGASGGPGEPVAELVAALKRREPALP
jgi:HK97 family phage prohead protease